MVAKARFPSSPQGTDLGFLGWSTVQGRSNRFRHQHQQTPNARIPVHYSVHFPPPYSALDQFFGKSYTAYPFGHVKLEDAAVQQRETHAILDFQAGRDVGVEKLVGSHGSSILSAGVRFPSIRIENRYQPPGRTRCSLSHCSHPRQSTVIQCFSTLPCSLPRLRGICWMPSEASVAWDRL